ncbi:MAG: heme-binding protein [Acidobacteria bacterium]|nr:MAG: heme-binding protein [Acidobacteriota bacterium]
MPLTLERAKKIIVACEKKAEEMGIPMGITVVDASGRMIASVRMDGTSWIAPDVARAKACAAAAFGQPTAEMRTLAQALPDFFASLATITGGEFAAAAGGVPIQEDGRIIGAVGVAGGPPDVDDACARAGVAAAGE